MGQKYGNYQALIYNFGYGSQLWGKGDSKFYTPLFIDLIDDVNQRSVNFGSIFFPDDNVTGYTFEKIENILVGARDLEEGLKIMLKMNKPAGISNEDIDELIDFYINL